MRHCVGWVNDILCEKIIGNRCHGPITHNISESCFQFETNISVWTANLFRSRLLNDKKKPKLF